MITIISFGYDPPDAAPKAHLTFDVRGLFRDPCVDPEFRELTGLDDTVVARVFAQRGANDYVYTAVNATKRLAKLAPIPAVAFGCSSGRYLSVAFACALSARLLQAGLVTDLIHLDIT